MMIETYKQTFNGHRKESRVGTISYSLLNIQFWYTSDGNQYLENGINQKIKLMDELV